MYILNEKNIDFLDPTDFKSLRKIEGNSIILISLMFLISARGGYCYCLPRATRNLVRLLEGITMLRNGGKYLPIDTM